MAEVYWWLFQTKAYVRTCDLEFADEIASRDPESVALEVQIAMRQNALKRQSRDIEAGRASGWTIASADTGFLSTNRAVSAFARAGRAFQAIGRGVFRSKTISFIS
jgi:hypothetical protein